MPFLNREGGNHPNQTLQLSVETHPSDATEMIQVAGEVDISTAPRLRRAVTAAFDRHPNRVCVDLAEVSFLDSAGVSVLAGAYKRATGQGCQFVVRRPSPAVQRVLAVTHLTDYVGLRG